MAPGNERPPNATLRFCAVTTAVSAMFWVLGSLADTELLVPGLPLSAGMFIAPTIGAWSAGAPPRRSDDRPPLTGFQAVWLWVACVALMPAVLVTSFLTMRIFGLTVPSQMSVSFDALAILTLVFLLTSACEEAGWTRFLTATLTARWSLLTTGLAVGAMWAALHVIPYVQAGRSWSWVAWQCAFTVAFRLIIVSAVAVLDGSWLAAVALHAAYDVTWALFPVDGSHYDPRFVAPVALGVAICVLPRAQRRTQAT
jgi:hypothetical protein